MYSALKSLLMMAFGRLSVEEQGLCFGRPSVYLRGRYMLMCMG